MTTTKNLIRAYIQDTPVPLFLQSFFQSPPENYHNSKEIEWDVDRETEDIAVPVPELGAGYRRNQTGGYTNKKIVPPAYKEAETIDAFSLIGTKAPGVDPYADVNFQVEATRRALLSARRLEKKIRRGMEVQASQILTTGKLDLVDSGGDTVFDLDFKPKSSHFPTVSIPWSTTATAVPIDDILALCEQIRDDGLEDPRRMIMGAGSFEAAMKVEPFRVRFDTRNITLGAINPMGDAGTRGGNYRGFLEVGNFRLDVYTYGGRYKHPNTGTITPYVGDKKVIIMSDGRLDATFGGMPTFGTDGRALQYMPSRLGRPSRNMDMYFNNWVSPDGTALNIGVGARPVLIPTAIDTYGCLDTDLA